ncbi:MAG TPA: hypothetical protein DCS93_15085 [Microscillaceae bacterium]|nr:hypothetical protein [Microscillaceae bacterium]
MNKTYRPSRKGLIINTTITGLVMLVISVFLYFILANSGASNHVNLIIVAILAATAFLYTAYVAIRFIYEKIIITDEALIYKGLFREKIFEIEKIKGYKKINYNVEVYSTVKYPWRTIKISDFYNDIGEIREWLWNHCQNLDLAELEKEMEVYEDDMQEILMDDNYGSNEKVVEENYERNRKYFNLFSYASLGIAIWYFIYPFPYAFLTAMVIGLPIIGLIIIYTTKGMARLYTGKSSAYFNMGVHLGMLISAMLVRALLDTNILSYQKVWGPAIVSSILLAPLVYFITRKEFEVEKFSKRFISFSFVVIVIFAYVFFTIVHANEQFDTNDYKVFYTQVTDKKITNGKYETCYLIVNDRLPNTNVNEVKIWEELYENIEVGDSVTIYLKPGVFKIPWIRYVAKKSDGG